MKKVRDDRAETRKGDVMGRKGTRTRGSRRSSPAITTTSVGLSTGRRDQEQGVGDRDILVPLASGYPVILNPDGLPRGFDRWKQELDHRMEVVDHHGLRVVRQDAEVLGEIERGTYPLVQVEDLLSRPSRGSH